MDVTLVLAHDMTDDILEPALDLLFSDDAPSAQLSFSGGEPFLSFDTLRHAVALAQRRAQAKARTLLLECITNGSRIGPAEVDFIKATGMRVTVSIDASSFEAAQAGLRALVQAGVAPEAMLVITPETSLFTCRAVSWLWSEGVRRVRATLSLESDWSAAAKDDLHEEFAAVGRQLIWHRLRGEEVIFQPFDEPPPASRWFSLLCADIGDATTAALADVQREGAELLVPIAVP